MFYGIVQMYSKYMYAWILYPYGMFLTNLERILECKKEIYLIF